MRIRAVIFDFGGVLCLHPTDDQIAAAARACRVPVPEFLHAFWSNRHAYDAGEIGPREYWSAIANSTGRAFDDVLIAEMVQREIDFWSRYDHRVIAWADQLRADGLRIGVLSNLPSPLGNHLRATRTLLDHFDHVTFSYELRVVKPQPAIYQDAIHGLKIQPEESLFLDDRQENVDGARAAGLQSTLYVSWEEFVPARYGLPAPAVARRQ